MFVDEKAFGEPVKTAEQTLKLSDAIRKGCVYRQQGTKTLFEPNRSCALGAAYEGTFGYSRSNDENSSNLSLIKFRKLLSEFPCLAKQIPLFGFCDYNLAADIGYANDFGYSREKIADILEKHGL